MRREGNTMQIKQAKMDDLNQIMEILRDGHHEKIYDPAIKPRHNMSREEYRNLANETIINHFD